VQEFGHDVAAISHHYPSDLADEDVLAIARETQRILLVADRDFGELIFQHGLAHAGVIFFRLPGASVQTKVQKLNCVVHEYAEELTDGTFVVVSPSRIRVADDPRL
jgi:predicted nuclease of predicted toxin-antitoxin system